MNSMRIQTIYSLFWKLLERVGRAIIELVVQIVLARLLAPEQFGALAIMLVFVNVGNVIVQSGLSTALIQDSEASSDDFSTVFWMSLCVSLALYAAVFFSAPSIAAFYSASELTWPLRVICLIYIINALNSVQVAKVTRDLEMRKIFIATLAASGISAISGIGAALAGLGLWALVLQQVTYQLSNCLSMFIQVNWSPSFVFNPKRARKLLGFGWRLLVSGLLDQGYSSLSDLIIGKQFSPTALGLVSQGKKYPMAIGSMLDGAIQPVMLSAVSRVQDNRAYVKIMVRRALKTSTYLITPSMTLFACCAPSFVPLLLGEQWASSVPYLQIYCFVYALLPIHTSNLQALNGMGRSDLFLKLELIKKSYGIVTLLICALGFKDVNLLVASYLVTGVIGTFVNAWPNKRVIGYSYLEQVRDIAPAFLLSAVASAPALAVGSIGLGAWETVLLQVLSFVATYLGLSALLHLEELSYIVSTAQELIGGARARS